MTGSRSRLTCTAAVAVVILASSEGLADINPWIATNIYNPEKWDTSGPETATPWLHPPTWTPDQDWGVLSGNLQATALTGSWGGLRDQLLEDGVFVSAAYFAQPAGNPVGGVDQGSSYKGDLGLAAFLDLERLVDWKRGYVTASFSYKEGNDTLSTRDVGNQFPVQLPSFDDDGAATRLVHLALGQQLFDNSVELVAGRIIAGEDFASLRLACTSLNQAICGNPIAGAQSISFPAYPSATWGGRVKFKPGSGWYAQTGAYLVYPDFRDQDDHGVEFGAPDGSGVLALGEFGYLVGRHRGDNSRPGKYKIGGYYDGERLQDLKSGKNKRGTWGIYAMGEQMLYAEDDTFDQGLSAFLSLSYAPPDVNRIEFMAAGGLSYKGPLKQRPNDAVSLIGAYGKFSSDLRSGERARGESGHTGEGLVEVNYRLQLAPWIFAQPDVQWIINPAGDSKTDDALVLGLGFGIVF
ncbi:MAG: carbohydrate porin [Pseudomonadota bacterium]